MKGHKDPEFLRYIVYSFGGKVSTFFEKNNSPVYGDENGKFPLDKYRTFVHNIEQQFDKLHVQGGTKHGNHLLHHQEALHSSQEDC